VESGIPMVNLMVTPSDVFKEISFIERLVELESEVIFSF